MAISIKQTELFDIERWRTVKIRDQEDTACVLDLYSGTEMDAEEISNLLTEYGIRNDVATLEHRDGTLSYCIGITAENIAEFQEVCARKQLATQLWSSSRFNELRDLVKKYPNEVFTLREADTFNSYDKTITVSAKDFDKMEAAYKNADLGAVFDFLEELEFEPNKKIYKMPDGRNVALSGHTFLYIEPKQDKNKDKAYSGLKVHIPIHVEYVPEMEQVMRSMYDVNPHFSYKFATKDTNLRNQQAGKILTIYINEGLDTPEELHNFFSVLDQKIKDENIRLYSPQELRALAALSNETPNLFDTRQEWKIRGAEDRFFYSYDGDARPGYNGYLKYSGQNAAYVTAGGSREHLKAENDPFEVVNLNLKVYRNPLSKNALANDPLPEGIFLRDGEINQITGKAKSEIVIGSAMGENAQAFIHELYKRAKEDGIISDKYADKYGTPSSYRLVLEDTPENRAFINAHVTRDGKELETPAFALTKINAGYSTSDAAILRNNHPLSKQELPQNGTLISDGHIYVGSAMEEKAQKFVRELSIRSVKAGIFSKKQSDQYGTPSSYRLVLKDTPENRAFINAHIKPDGRSIYTQEEAQNRIHPKPTPMPYILGAYAAQRKTYA